MEQVRRAKINGCEYTMEEVRRAKINGCEYTMEEVLYNKHCAEKIKKTIVNNQEDLIELFRVLNEEELERENAQIRLGGCLDRVVYNFLNMYEECIKSSISIDRLIDAAEKANYMDFFRYLILNLSEYIEDEKAKYIRKIIEIINQRGTLEQIEIIAYCAEYILEQEEMDLLFDGFIKHGDIFFLIKTVIGRLSDTFDMKKLVVVFEEKLDKMIAEEDIEGVLNFAEGNLKIISNCRKVDFTNSINKIISFILVKGTAKDIYSLARYSYQTPYFRRIIRALIETNRWDYWLSIIDVFGKNKEAMCEALGDLIDAVLKTNVPAYIYLFFARTKKYLSEDDIKRILVTIIELEDKTYTEYVIMELRSIELSQNVKEFIQQHYPNISTSVVLNYLYVNQFDIFMGDPAWEIKYLFSDGINTNFSFDEIGIAVHEDGSFDNAKQLVLSNIDAGL